MEQMIAHRSKQQTLQRQIQMLGPHLKKKKPNPNLNPNHKKTIKTTSLGKEHARSKPKLKLDDNHFKKTNKALLSVSIETQQRPPNPQHHKSIIDNQLKPKKNSPGLKRKLKTNHVQSAIFKHDVVRKRDTQSALQPKKTSKEKTGRAKKTRLVIDGKHRGARSDLTIYPDMQGELIFSMTSSGEVFFSSYAESRDEMESKIPFIKSKKASYDMNIDPNVALEKNIKREFRRKEQAVIKIQKIWRGYQTRRILEPFVNTELSRLEERLNEMRSNRDREFSERIGVGKADKKDFYGTFLDAEIHIEERKLSISNDFSVASRKDDFSSIECSGIDNDQVSGFEHPKSHPQDGPEDEPENEEEEDYNEEESDLDEEISDFHLYRHQRPIYSHEELDDYFKERRKSGQAEQNSQNEGEEREEEEEGYQGEYSGEEDKYQPEIIHETNEEYLESRKNSMQSKNPKGVDYSIRRVSSQNMQPPDPISEQAEKEVVVESPHQPPSVFQTLEIKDTSPKQGYREKLERLKDMEIGKWEEIISYIKASMGDNPSKELRIVLNEVILRSEVNKQQLNDREGSRREEDSVRDENVVTLKTEEDKQDKEARKDTQITTTEESKNNYKFERNPAKQEERPSQFQPFKRKNLKLEIDSQNNEYSLNDPMRSRSKASDFQNTQKFNFDEGNSPAESSRNHYISRVVELDYSFARNSGFNSEAVNAIITLREDVLQERQKAEYLKLNDLLQDKRISLEEFQLMLMKLQRHAQDQRTDINKSKKEIEKGLKVAAKVIAKAEKDAHLLGKRIGVSRSAESLKVSTKLSNLILLNNIVPEERLKERLKEKQKKRSNEKEKSPLLQEGKPPRLTRNFFINEDGSDSDQLDFTEEQFQQFSRPSLSNEFSELSRNIIITQEFLLRGDEPVSQVSSSKESEHESHEEYVSQVTEGVISRLMYECAIECYKSPTILESLSNKFDIQSAKSRRVDKDQLCGFVEEIFENLPEKSVLLSRLNQQICPPPLELLKCMRVDLFPVDYDEEGDLSEMDKYEFIIPQTICIDAIARLSSKRLYRMPQVPFQDIERTGLLDPFLKMILQKREKFCQLRLQEMVSKSKEVYQAEMHCVFDCWNQQMIIQKSEVRGFSGIGLNEGTLSLCDQNTCVEEVEVDSHIVRAKLKLLGIIRGEGMGGVLEKRERQDKMDTEDVCGNEGSWVCYTDEALGFILELDFVIFEELMIEMARVLHKKTLALSLMR